MNKTLLAAGFTLLSLSSNVFANEFVVSYDGFYDRLKILSKGDFSRVDVGFYLINQQAEPCPIKQGQIITKSNEYPLNYTTNSKLLLPFDQTLDKDKAVITIQPEAGNQCQLKMQLESTGNYGNSVTYSEMESLQHAFEKLMGQLSGFFMRTVFSFLMPDVKGVTLVFDNPITQSEGATEQIKCDAMETVGATNTMKLVTVS